jgi:hypothetical protein
MEYTPDDFGWECIDGHYDCADTEHGPCLYYSRYGPEHDRIVENVLRQIFPPHKD